MPSCQLVITQAKVDAAVSGLLPILQQVYEFLRNDQILTKFDTRKETLACITQVVNDSTQFIKNYADVKSSCETFTPVSDYSPLTDCR